MFTNFHSKQEQDVTRLANWIQQATATVAPVWPLDRSIAVNPWWQQRTESIHEVAAEQLAWFNIPLVKGAEGLLSEGRFHGSVAASYDATQAQRKLRTLPWLTEIQQQMSQFCALWVNYPAQVGQHHDINQRMFKQWLKVVRQDRGIALLLNHKNIQQHLENLPEDIFELYQIALHQLPLTAAQWPIYLQVLLHDLYGWASIFSQRRWQRELTQQQDFNDELNQLLAIRLAWDLVCWQSSDEALQQQFKLTWSHYLERKQQVAIQLQPLWQQQSKREQHYQQQLTTQLMTPSTKQSENTLGKPPKLQAVCCIDVRSEPMRRALEAQHEGIQTIGFAGFFGLPVEYQVSAELSKPQLPALLAPQWQVQLSGHHDTSEQVSKIWRSASWHRAHESPAGAYGWVEMSGLAKIAKLLKKTLTYQPQQRIAASLVNTGPWLITRHQQPVSNRELAQVAAQVLTGMSLTEAFAESVLLIGHTASTHNNPHAASLECGACGGQSGAVNAQVLAQILNEPSVRQLLTEHHQISIPSQTRFIAALHNTTLQQLQLLSADVPQDVATWIAAANTQAQQEQAQRLLGQQAATVPPQQLLRQRAGSWAEVRPEWGLARNTAIIFAPRSVTRSLNFDGRVFLHEYVAEHDQDQSLLTQLLTAPMVVAHWINMQYYASTVAPQQFGSGNKLLHNVVADGLGVFEGNGGDLRIGLARQSVHDGQDWYHEPLRLTVVIAADTVAIDQVIAAQPVVKQLVDNEWLWLWQWQPSTATLQQRTATGWVAVPKT